LLELDLYTIELRTTRWEKMLRWYREVLGFPVLIRVVEDRYALLGTSRGRIAIMERKEVDPPSSRYSLAFETNRLDPVAERIQVRGGELRRNSKHVEGLQEIVTADPDGNRVRIFAWPRSAMTDINQ